MTLCSALIQCHIDYAASTWFAGITKTLKHRLQVCQNKVVRFILNMSRMQTVKYTILNSLDLLNIDDRMRQFRLYHALTYMENHQFYPPTNFTLMLMSSVGSAS